MTNRLNIREPRLDVRDVLPLAKLDVLVTPLVAFDEGGQRLGMGGGFYDRTLQNWHCRLQRRFFDLNFSVKGEGGEPPSCVLTVNMLGKR